MRQTITEDFIASITRRNILALDCATHCGWYTFADWGTAIFPETDKAPKKYGDDYQQHKAWREWLVKMFKEHNIKMVVAENVEVSKSFVALRKLSEFRGVLCEVCATHNIPVLFVGVTQLKKWATGNGNASKQMMMEWACKRWHIDPEEDDNIADATHLFFYAVKRYNLK